jgi:hypothetical protein
MLIHFPPKTIHLIHFMKIFMVNSVHKKKHILLLMVMLCSMAKNHTGWCPPVISWLKDPIKYRYIYHKPYFFASFLHQQLAFTNWGTTFLGFYPVGDMQSGYIIICFTSLTFSATLPFPGPMNCSAILG